MQACLTNRARVASTAKVCWGQALLVACCTVGLGEHQTGMGSCNLLLTTRALLNGGLPLLLAAEVKASLATVPAPLLTMAAAPRGSNAWIINREIQLQFETHGCPMQPFGNCQLHGHRGVAVQAAVGGGHSRRQRRPQLGHC